MIITTDKVKDYLGITVDTYDQQLEDLQNRLQAAIEKSLDWYFGPPREVTEFLDGNGKRTLFLRQPPADDSTTVEVNSHALEIGEFSIGGRKLRRIGSVWAPGLENVEVTYQEGYEEGTAPGDIQQLLLELMDTRVVVGSTGGAGVIQSESIGGYSYTIDTDTAVDFESSGLWKGVVGAWKRGLI